MQIELSETQFTQVLDTIIRIKSEQKPTVYYNNCTFSNPLTLTEDVNQQQGEESKTEESELIKFVEEKTGYEPGQIKWIIDTANEFYANRG